MSKFFDRLIAEALTKGKSAVRTDESYLENREYNRTYKKIIDLLVTRMFEQRIDNDLLRFIFRDLSYNERLIILFHVLMEYGIEDTASVIGTNRDSVYSLKYRALKKFRDAIDDLD